LKLILVKGKYEVPGFAIPAEGVKRLLGEWTATTGANRLAIVFRFETTSSGKLAVFVDVPDQRVKSVAVRDFAMNGDQITIKLPGLSGDTYTGSVSGNSMKGTFKLNSIVRELNLARGKYLPGINEMAATDIKRLAGLWVAKYAPGGPTYTIVWKFERTADAKLSALASAPETGPDELPITDVLLKRSKDLGVLESGYYVVPSAQWGRAVRRLFSRMPSTCNATCCRTHSLRRIVWRMGRKYGGARALMSPPGALPRFTSRESVYI
jgi:hypothetical protein